MPANDRTDELGKLIGLIASIIGLMLAVFALLGAISGSQITAPIAAAVVGFILTTVLVYTGKLELPLALITWIGAVVVLVVIYLWISQPATVKGRIVDTGGKPLIGRALILTDADGIDRKAVSDENGEFEVHNVPEGRYTIVAEGSLVFSGNVSPPKVEPSKSRVFQ